MEQQENRISAKEQFEALFNFATIGIVVTDKAGKIVNFNKQAERQFGFDREEVFGKEQAVGHYQDFQEQRLV